MNSGFHHPADVFAKLAALQAGGVRASLAIVTQVTGGAMRAPGAVMVIDEGGETYGYISNGCVDGDIVAQAIRAKQNLALRYGEGSPFGDIILPCGGAIEVLLIANPDEAYVANIAKTLAVRQGVSIRANLSDGLTEARGDFTAHYAPKLRLNIVGNGAAVPALEAQARSSGFETTIVEHGDVVPSDKWTAWIVLFHDHEKEPPILKQALASDAFYIGAMGSRKTHATRIEALKADGVSESQIARIHGPIGLIPSMRDANLLALSVLAQVVEQAQKLGRL